MGIRQNGRGFLVNSSMGKLTVVFAMVAIGDFIFYSQPFGWGLGLYSSLILVSLCLSNSLFLKERQNRSIALLCIMLLVAMAWDPSTLALALFAFLVILSLIISRQGPITDASPWGSDVIGLIRQILVKWLVDFKRKDIIRKRAATHKGPRQNTIAYVLPPIVLSGVFIYLLSEANPLISRSLDALDWSTLSNLISMKRWLFWACFGLTLWGLFRARLNGKVMLEQKPAKSDPGIWFNKSAVKLSLLLFNGIFAVQNIIDAVFVLGHEELPDGMSFATYAHSGAYPLVFAVIVAAIYVLVVFGEKNTACQSTLARNLVYVWIGQNVLMTMAALYRLLSYIEAYSMTSLRLAAMIWMGLIVAGLILIICKISMAKTSKWLVNRNTLVLACTLYACCFVDFDGFIATYNVRHNSEVTSIGPILDLAYLGRIGPSALPALQEVQNNSLYNQRTKISAEIIAARLKQDLRTEMDQNWRAWTGQKLQLLYQIDHTGKYPYYKEKLKE